MVTDFAVEKRAAFLGVAGCPNDNEPIWKCVATAATTLARAIQEVDTDLLNGFNQFPSHSDRGRLVLVPILAEKQGSTGPDALDIEGSGGASHRGSCSLALRWLYHAQTGVCVTLWRLGPWVRPRT